MPGNTHIVIGDGLATINQHPGDYEIYFMDAVLYFDNAEKAVEAYENLHGEAYLWFRGSGEEPTKLIEAKIMSDYHFLGKKNGHGIVHPITQRRNPTTFLF